MNTVVLEKCRPCGGVIIWTGKQIYCTGCYRDYDFLAKEHGIVLTAGEAVTK